MDKSIYLASFTLGEAPYLGWHKLLQNIMIMTIYCMFYFYRHKTKYKHLDTPIPVLQQLQLWIDTAVQLMFRK